MDNIMGKMLSIPNYSRLEGVMLLLCSIGCFLGWSTDQTFQLYSIILLSFGLMYFLICLVYFIIVEDGAPIALTLILFIGGIIYWKYTSFFNQQLYADVLFKIAKVFAVVFGVFSLKMIHGSKFMKKEIKRWQEVVKFCNANADFVWEFGKDAPNGFASK